MLKKHQRTRARNQSPMSRSIHFGYPYKYPRSVVNFHVNKMFSWDSDDTLEFVIFASEGEF